MVWVRVDEEFAQHPKVLKAGPLGMAMQVAALCYANRYLTDGFIPQQAAPMLLDFSGLGMRMWQGEVMGGGEDATWELVVEDLVHAGLWNEVPGGWQIHDFEEYQPTRADIQKKREAGAKGGRSKGPKAPQEPPAKAERKQVLKHKGSMRLVSAQADPVPDTDTQNDEPPDDADASPADEGPGVEEFWNAYPRHRDNGKPGGGGSKAKTRKLWAKLKPAERAACLVGARHYRADVEARDAPVAHTTTWLSERRWEGWQEPATPRARGKPIGHDAGEADRHNPDAWSWDAYDRAREAK